MTMSEINVSRRRLLANGALAGGAVVLGTGALSACSSSGSSTSSASRTLRVGVLGGGNAETLNFNSALSETDVARTAQIFEGLTTFDPSGKVVNRLAESLEPDVAGQVWTIRVREATFHDGRPLTADDVLYSLQYMADPKNKADAAAALSLVDVPRCKKVDDRTVQVVLSRPNFLFPTLLGERSVAIMPMGTKNFDKPIGTGPFKFDSFKPGDRSRFLRYDDYYGGAPKVEELEIVSIDDAAARLNALRSGTVDVIAEVSPELIKGAESGSVKLIQTSSGSFSTMYMRMSKAPFTDVRVRQAMRLLADREQMIDNALFSAGSLGNDLSSPFDPYYASDLPQRSYDPDQARSLLKAAGAEGLTVELHTSDAGLAMLQSSTLYAAQAAEAGVTVKLKKWPTSEYWSRAWLKEPFACSHWGGRPLISHLQLSALPGASYNETDWDSPDFNKLVDTAMASADEGVRREALVDAQSMLHEEGGYVIWGFAKNVDALNSRVQGITPSAIRPLGNYDFREASLS